MKVHQIIGEVMPTRNFYIALYDEQQDVISFPYFVDEIDMPSQPQKSGKGLTEYVIRTGTSLLCDARKHQELTDGGEAELVGEASAIWLGVPLIIDHKTVGVMVVQDYKSEHTYGEREKQILEFVSAQVARAIQRKQAEEALAAAHSQIKALHDNLDEALFSVDIVGNKMLQVSSAHEKVFGYPPAKFFENPRLWYELIIPEDKHIIDAGYPVLMAGKTLKHQFRIRRPDGQIAWIEAKMKPTLDEHGVLVRLDGFASDVTEGKRGEESLLLQTTYFQQLFENSPEGIVLLDRQYCVVNTNAAFEKMFQYKLEELNGHPLDGFIVPEDRVEEARKLGSESMAGGTVQQETVRRRKDGTTIDVIIIGYPIVIRSERVGIYGIYVDVSNYKKLQAQLLRTQRLESIGTLAGGIAHDLNNALGPILLGVQVIAKYITDDRARQLLQSMEGSAKRGADMVRQILSFARGLSGEFGILNPRHVIGEVDRIIRETFPKNIELELSIPKTLWNVSGDATQLHQLLVNLCVNSRDAMPGGGRLTIACENFTVDNTYLHMHAGLKAGPHILLKVSDTGTGMPKGVLEKIFDPFFTTKDPGKGTGLGLSTVDTIVKGHGGVVDVYSEVNRGTTFRVLIPATLSADDQPSPVLKEEGSGGRGEVLLVVDDEVTLREMTKQVLEMFGYIVLTAADGTEAITQFIEHKADVKLVVTDMAMPIMDGEATIRALKRISPDIKIIATSGQHDAISDASAQRLGVTRSLSKPFTAEQLLKVVGEVLGGEAVKGEV
jgi:PAS domain S-box-containing protein